MPTLKRKSAAAAMLMCVAALTGCQSHARAAGGHAGAGASAGADADAGACSAQLTLDSNSVWWPDVRNRIHVTVRGVEPGTVLDVSVGKGPSGTALLPATQVLDVRDVGPSGCGSANTFVTVDTLPSSSRLDVADVVAAVTSNGREVATAHLRRSWSRSLNTWAEKNLDCHPYFFVPLRGSGTGWTQGPTPHIEFEYGSYEPGAKASDRELYPMLASLYEALKDTSALSAMGFFVPPGYQAPHVSFDDGFLRAMYVTGPAAVQDSLNAVARVCPTSRFILAGFSQGAYVAHRVAATAPTPLSQRIAATVAVGDPARGMDAAVQIGLPSVPKTSGIVVNFQKFKALGSLLQANQVRCMALSDACSVPVLEQLAALAAAPTAAKGIFMTPSSRAFRIATLYVPDDWVADVAGAGIPSGLFTSAITLCTQQIERPNAFGWAECEKQFSAAWSRGQQAHGSYGQTDWLARAVEFILRVSKDT